MNQDKIKNKNERNMNQDKSERNTNQDKNKRNMSQDKSERNMSQDKSERNTSQDKSERNMSQDKSERNTSQDKSNMNQDKSEWNDMHQEKNERNMNQDKNRNDKIQDKSHRKNDRSIFHDLYDHNKKNESKSHQGQEKSIITEIDEVPLTKERKVPKDLTVLGNAGLPRATIAVSKEVPEGTSGSSTNKTVLQQHVEFWDTDQDNIITPLDIWNGFRKLGFSLAYSALAVCLISGALSYPTQKSWIPILGNPLFNIYVNTINKDKHGSDSETFDTEGRFVPEKFEEIFSKYDRDNKGGLSLKDIICMIRGNANAMDPFGWSASTLEWGTLYLLCAKDGMVTKEDIRTCYDGSLFFRMQEKEEKRQKGVPIIKSSATFNIDAKEE